MHISFRGFHFVTQICANTCSRQVHKSLTLCMQVLPSLTFLLVVSENIYILFKVLHYFPCSYFSALAEAACFEKHAHKHP